MMPWHSSLAQWIRGWGQRGWAAPAGVCLCLFLLLTACGQSAPTGEKCLNCHEGIEEISAAHPMESFACVTCHGGNPQATEAEAAHAGMRGGRNPSDLAVLDAACNCHNGLAETGQDHIHRVRTSLQTTYAGAIAQVSFAFGAQPDPTARYGMLAVTDDNITTATGQPALELFRPGPDDSPMLHRFADNCLFCHVGGEPLAQPYFYRSTGCAACHMVYDNDGLYKGGDPTIDPAEPGHAREHRFTTAIPFTQCNHCHNRGNYSLAQMEFLPRPDLPDDRPLTDLERRELEYYQPIAQFTLCEWKLDCIDCHTNGEVMGDGDIHSSKLEVQYNQCQTCHGTPDALPLLTTIDSADHPAIRSANLNPNYEVRVGDTVIATTRGETFGWVLWDGQRLWLTKKVDGMVYEVPLALGTACQQKPDEQASQYCHECHAYQRTVVPLP